MDNKSNEDAGEEPSNDNVQNDPPKRQQSKNKNKEDIKLRKCLFKVNSVKLQKIIKIFKMPIKNFGIGTIAYSIMQSLKALKCPDG